MQTKIYVALFLFTAFSSCVTFKQFDDRAKASREMTYEASIIKNNGTVYTGEQLKHKNYDPYDANLVRVTYKDNALTLDSKKYNDSDVVAFQDTKAFHKRFNNIYLIRLVKGKMNLYYFDATGYDKTFSSQQNGPTNITRKNERRSTYFFDKNGGKINPIGLTELKEAIKDKPQALKKLNASYPKDSYAKELNVEKLVSVVELYNK